MSTKLQNLLIALQIDGEQYFVELPKGAMEAVLTMVACKSKGGKLALVPAPAAFNFNAILKEMNEREPS